MKCLILDILHTEGNLRFACIIEVGAILLDLESGKRKTLIDTLVFEDGFEPSRFRKSLIFQKTDITPTEILDAPDADEIFPQLESLIGKYGFTAFDVNNELPYLASRGIVSLDEGWVHDCIQAKATEYWNKIIKEKAERERSKKWQQYITPAVELKEICGFLRIETSSQFRAATNAELEAQICYHLYKEGFWNRKNSPQLIF